MVNIYNNLLLFQFYFKKHKNPETEVIFYASLKKNIDFKKKKKFQNLEKFKVVQFIFNCILCKT